MSREKLKSIIDDFGIRGFVSFFREKSTSFARLDDPLNQYDDDRFSDFYEIGEIEFENSSDRLVIIGAKVNNELTDRSGKKAQYEKAKRILKDLNLYNAGIFIFYNDSSKFRFSLVYEQSIGTKRTFSNFRRFTYFVSPEFTNRTFLQQIGDGDFSTLDNIKDSFSVEKVNKEFYGKIAEFFYELVGSEVEKGKYDRIMKLPVNEDENRIYQEFAVRLIGRIIFCWFLKYKKSPNNIPLIPNTILSSKAVLMGYYHSVLEKLFFEVLNTPQDQRKKIPANSDNIPFLNGGLFEPHNNDFYNGNPFYSLTIPDNWFTELLGVLEQYNFTIDENSTVDVDISVDPEMLGRIFENLLAEINPDTGKTARKATGSYYTPRPIVEYMVDESIKQYLITKTNINEESIASLLSYETSDTSLNENEKDSVIKALDEIKVIDPACGSGAFPMGILQKMLLILQKVDPESKKWLGKQLDRIENEFYRKEFEEKLKNENWDYVHKLGIVQNSIYGVDIQPIAVDISRLRFFLSLIVDEKIDDDKPNRGVEPLPNLEFKFVSANSLIGLGDQPILETPGEFERLRELRTEYLNSRSENKKHIEEEFRAIQYRMFQRSLQFGGKDSQTSKISSWDPFSDEKSDWFDPEWMFGIKDKFDVVIANPPYGFRDVLSKKEKDYFRKEKGIQFPSGDIAEIFTIFALKYLVCKGGILTYIIPKKSLYGESWKNLRKIWLSHNLVYLMDASQAFEKVLLEQISFSVINENSKRKKVAISVLNRFKGLIDVFGFFSLEKIFTDDLKNAQIYKAIFPESMLNKIKNLSIADNQKLVKGEIGISNITQYLTFEPNGNYPCVKGIDITRYGLKPQKRYLLGKIAKDHIEQYQGDKIVSQEIIAHIQNPQPHILITIFYDNTNRLVNDTCVEIKVLDKRIERKFLLAYYQSTFCNWYAYNLVYNRAIRTMHFIDYYITQIPIPKVILENIEPQKKIIDIVDRILGITKDDDYLTNPAKQSKVKEYEHQIDEMVYELYGLTPEEIAIVEGKK